jgi:hypothetical protein
MRVLPGPPLQLLLVDRDGGVIGCSAASRMDGPRGSVADWRWLRFEVARRAFPVAFPRALQRRFQGRIGVNADVA